MTDPPILRHIVVETHVPGGATESLTVELPDAPFTVARLIRAKAGAEWDAARPGRAGRESTPPMPGDTPAPATRADAIRAALDAYRAGWYVIFVDDEPTAALDAPLAPRPETRIRFVRLYPGEATTPGEAPPTVLK